MSGGFGERLRAVIAERGRLCVGIDPHEHLLTQWGLDASAAGAREFGLRVVDAAAGRAGIVKPQVAFFERYGSAGYAALEDVLAAARAAGLLVIADAKRGDIGSTMDAYARAWLTPGSPLEADALTVNPYLGVGSLGDTVTLALAHGKGLFVLAATSNPEAAELQTGRVGAQTVAGRVVADVTEVNARTTEPGEWGSIGLVVGATVDRAAFGLPDDHHAPGADPRAGLRPPGRHPLRLRRALRVARSGGRRQRESRHPRRRRGRGRRSNPGTSRPARGGSPWLTHSTHPRSTAPRHPAAPSPRGAPAPR